MAPILLESSSLLSAFFLFAVCYLHFNSSTLLLGDFHFFGEVIAIIPQVTDNRFRNGVLPRSTDKRVTKGLQRFVKKALHLIERHILCPQIDTHVIFMLVLQQRQNRSSCMQGFFILSIRRFSHDLIWYVFFVQRQCQYFASFLVFLPQLV